MSIKRVLFVCIHNSARSQMGEAFLNHLSSDTFQAESAGITPGSVNPLVVKSMSEVGIDMSGHTANSVFDFQKEGRNYDYVITVCEKEAAEQCPTFSGGAAQRISWSFKNPSDLEGDTHTKLKQIAIIRDEIKGHVLNFIKENK